MDLYFQILACMATELSSCTNNVSCTCCFAPGWGESPWIYAHIQAFSHILEKIYKQNTYWTVGNQWLSDNIVHCRVKLMANCKPFLCSDQSQTKTIHLNSLLLVKTLTCAKIVVLAHNTFCNYDMCVCVCVCFVLIQKTSFFSYWLFSQFRLIQLLTFLIIHQMNKLMKLKRTSIKFALVQSVASFPYYSR